MTKDEALKLALEALEPLVSLSIEPEDLAGIYKAIKAIKEALAQPEMRPDEISTDELIYMSGRYDGMKQERALWELSRLGQEIEAQQGQAPVKRSIQEMLQPDAYLPNGDLNPKYTTPPQRPWVGLTDEEINAAAACQSWKPFAQAIETKLKEKNT